MVRRKTTSGKRAVQNSPTSKSSRRQPVVQENDSNLSSLTENVSRQDLHSEIQSRMYKKGTQNISTPVNKRVYLSVFRNTERKAVNANALREISQYQHNTNLLIPRANFERLCREIIKEYGGPDLKVGNDALSCLQESAEMYLVQFFEDAYLCSRHASRMTLMAKDLRLARRIGGRCGFYM